MMVRVSRYALAAALEGAALHPSARALHGCNNTACVRVRGPGEIGLRHIVSGSQRRIARTSVLRSAVFLRFSPFRWCSNPGVPSCRTAVGAGIAGVDGGGCGATR